MTLEPKPYLEYLEKEMTIMGILSAFSVGLATFATKEILTANEGFLAKVSEQGQSHVFIGAALALLAALLFYLQRSHLAWYYGQISLTQSLGSSSHYTIKDLLEWADGWDSWARYQTGFIALTLSFASYVYGIGQVIYPTLTSVSHLWSLCIPLLAGTLTAIIRWYAFFKFPQEDYPVYSWVQSFKNN